LLTGNNTNLCAVPGKKVYYCQAALFATALISNDSIAMATAATHKTLSAAHGVLRAENRTLSAPLHLNLNRVLSVMLLHEFAATAHTPPLIARLHAEC
jgi:hypothetical protein